MIASLSSLAQNALEQFGALGLFLVMVAEHVFPPVPSELVLPLAGFEVSRGAMTFTTALLASTAGSIAGAMLLYEIARRGGRPAILRLHRMLRVDAEALTRAEQRFARHGTWLVLLGRMVPGLRSLVSLPPGLLRMPVRRYLALTAAGSLAWNALLITLGQQLGTGWDQVGPVIAPVATVLAIATMVAGALLFLRWRRGQAAVGDGSSQTPGLEHGTPVEDQERGSDEEQQRLVERSGDGEQPDRGKPPERGRDARIPRQRLGRANRPVK